MPKVLIPIAQGCEEIEAVTVIDILRRAGITVVRELKRTVVKKPSTGVELFWNGCPVLTAFGKFERQLSLDWRKSLSLSDTVIVHAARQTNT